MNRKLVKLFLRLTLGITFLSPVLDRFGIWGASWGNWKNFVGYTQELLPWLSADLVQVAAIVATVAEVLFGIFLLIGLKVRLVANLSGLLLLLFALAMTFSLGIKAPLNYSVFSASAAAFALGTFKVKFLEIK